MSQLPSYSRLSLPHQMFVHAYLQTMDGTKAAAMLFPESSHDKNASRARRLMQREDIKQAIEDRLAERDEKFTVKLSDQVKRIRDLMDRALAIDGAEQRLSTFKFLLQCEAEINKASGLQHVRHTHEQKQGIEVHIHGMDPVEEKTVDGDAIVVPPAQLEEPADPVTYDLTDLDHISDDVPEDVPDPDDDLPEGLQ